jgi:hypothetical protein
MYILIYLSIYISIYLSIFIFLFALGPEGENTEEAEVKKDLFIMGINNIDANRGVSSVAA